LSLTRRAIEPASRWRWSCTAWACRCWC